MGQLQMLPVQLESITCAACGVEFAMPRHLLDTKRDNKGEVHCPNGHANTWVKSKAEQLQEELDRTKATLERTRQLEASQLRRAEAAEKKLARAKAGVCPCCKRSFTALRRHMKTKHPDWKP